MHPKHLCPIVCFSLLFAIGCQSQNPAVSSADSTRSTPFTHPAKITFDENGVLLIDGVKTFPINLTVIPHPDGVTPTGKNAFQEFHDAGCTFMRTGPNASAREKTKVSTKTGKAAEEDESAEWDAKTYASEKAYQESAAAHGMRCCPWLGWTLANFNPGNAKLEAELRTLVNTFKDSPGLGLWKAADEPEWGNEHNPAHSTPEQVAHVADIIHELDPNHPIWLVQAPRGTVESMKRYINGFDVGGIDIYPISYPPGNHSEMPNKDISMVGDWTRFIKEAAAPKPYWMTLQISFSGTTPSPSHPKSIIRFPSLPEQRFMAYQAIINGSRGLTFFGGGNIPTLNARDKKLGWNWTYWEKVMKPLLDEIGTNSPIEPALVAADSKLPIKVASEAGPDRKPYHESPNIELLTREVGNDVYIFACMTKSGPTIQVRFTGLPTTSALGQVMFEEPRTVDSKDGAFLDWFAPYDVHVYKFHK